MEKIKVNSETFKLIEKGQTNLFNGHSFDGEYYWVDVSSSMFDNIMLKMIEQEKTADEVIKNIISTQLA